MEKEHARLIYKLVWEIHRQFNVDWEDLYSEAVVTYYVKLKRHNSNRGQKSTFIFTCIKNRLYNYIKEQRRDTIIYVDKYPVDMIIDKTPFFVFFDSLSKDSKFIACLILWNPHKYLAMPSRKARGHIARTLENKFGWTADRIWKSFRVLKEELKNVQNT